MALDIVHSVREEASESNERPDILSKVLQHIIPQGIEVPKPESIFELSGIPVFTKKSISTLTGPAKSGKTTATAWIVAQCINQGLTVLWLDTEQGEYYGSRTQSWVLHIAGMQTCPSFHYLDARVFPAAERYTMLEEAIKHFSPDLVIVDGIRDLLYDINNAEESTICSGNMIRLSQEFDCHILSILHTNKGNDNERGHLGTEMRNKSETVISINMDEARNVVCSPKFTRSEPFQEFAFTRDSYGIPKLVEDYYSNIEVGIGKRSVKASDYTLEQHKEILSFIFKGVSKLTYNDLHLGIIAAYETHGITVGVMKSKAFIEHFKQQGLLYWEKEGKFTIYSLKD